MILTQQQINNLITGREMTVELPASKKGLRRFMQINEKELTSYQEWDGIQGIVALEVVLKEHLQDSSMMVTSDKTDYPL